MTRAAPARGRGQQWIALSVGLLMVVSGAAMRSSAAAPAGPRVSVIVQKLSAADHAPEEAVRRLGGAVDKELWIVNGFSARVPSAAVSLLRRLPGVGMVSPDATVRMKGFYGEQSGVASAVYPEVTGATKAWHDGLTGQGINVALIDTGVNTSGDLAGKVVHAEDFTTEQDNRDSYGHGTFVAGLIAGNGAGLNGAVKGEAPGAGLVSVKIAGRDGLTDVVKVLAALEWVVTFKDAYGIRVVNLSLGTDSTQSYKVDPLDFAVERVWNAGVVVVVAAGNHGPTPGSISKPADDPFVISVGSSDDHTTTARGDDTIAPFSAAGPTAADGIAKPDLVAPGAHLVSSRSPMSAVDVANASAEVAPSYFKGSGTSFAAGVVAGAAAMVLQADGSLDPNQVKYRLTSTASPLTLPGAGSQGMGELDVHKATKSTSLLEANQGAAPAAGGGSLQATRGSGAFRDAGGGVLPDDAVNAGMGFDPAPYFGSQWAGSQWNGSQWNGSQWNGSQWNGSQWNGSQWNLLQWAVSLWNGSQWNGSQWNGSQWNGSQWNGSQWAALQWAGSQWASFDWAGSQWSGSQWNAVDWNVVEWTGSQWY